MSPSPFPWPRLLVAWNVSRPPRPSTQAGAWVEERGDDWYLRLDLRSLLPTRRLIINVTHVTTSWQNAWEFHVSLSLRNNPQILWRPLFVQMLRSWVWSSSAGTLSTATPERKCRGDDQMHVICDHWVMRQFVLWVSCQNGERFVSNWPWNAHEIRVPS